MPVLQKKKKHNFSKLTWSYVKEYLCFYKTNLFSSLRYWNVAFSEKVPFACRIIYL